MPEGDTVWRTARHLDQALTGSTLRRGELRVPAYATTDLAGRTVNGTVSRGKHLLTRLDDDLTLHTHLKMEGAWHLYRPTGRWRRPGHQARVVLESDAWTAVGFSLGVVELLARDAEEQAVGHLGPDLLGPDWDAREALRRLSAAPDRPLAQALLDQRNLAGLGNLYATELCFLAGVDPRAPVSAVPDLPRLLDRAHRLLRANVERVEQTTTGDTRHGRRTWVYRRDRQSCWRCGSLVEVAMLGEPGRERAAYWCPVCQPPHRR